MVKTDTIVAGVHFLADEKPELVAARALRVCLSDLAAGGAMPYAYQLSLSLTRDWTERWVAGFARGLAADQRRFGIALSGGDTTGTPGPTTVTIAAFGRVARGKGLGRDSARTGDELWVTGTIGDAALGLLAARGELKAPALEKRYRLPQPRSRSGRAWSVSRARRRTSPTACWLTPDTSPMLRGCRCISSGISCRCRPRPGAFSRTKPALWAMPSAVATTMSSRSPSRRASGRGCWRRRVRPA